MRNRLLLLMLAMAVVAAVIAAAASLEVDGGVIQTFHEQVTVTTPTPVSVPGGCTRSVGYWQNHPEAWPLELVELGDDSYSGDEAVEILETAPQGDATYLLAHQLIAAKLNAAAGADESAVEEAMRQADEWLGQHPLGSAPGGAERDEGIALAERLEGYNSGEIGPGACAEEEAAGEVDWSGEAAGHESGPRVTCALDGAPRTGQAPLEVQLTAAVTATGETTETLQYVWQLSDEDLTAGGLVRRQTYEEAGEYTARFAVVDGSDPTAPLCTDSVEVKVSAPSADYSVASGCASQGAGWLGIDAGSTWARGVFTGTEETLHFDLPAGEMEMFDLEEVLYEAEEWAYVVTSPQGVETGTLTLGPCVELGNPTCNPGWTGELGRRNDDHWHVRASGSGAQAVRLVTAWTHEETWRESGTSDLGTVQVHRDGTWSMDVAMPGPSDGRGRIEVQNQAGEWLRFEACAFQGEAPLGTWISLWGTNGSQAFPAKTTEPQRAVMSWLVSGGWGPQDVRFWWVPCVRRRTDGGETEICGRHLVEPVDQWIRHSGTVVRFYPAKAMLLDNHRHWAWRPEDDFVVESDTGKIYDVWAADAGDLYQYAFGRAQVDFVPNPEFVEPGDLFTMVWGADFRVPARDPVYEPGTRLREHKALRALVVASWEDPKDPAVLETYGWGGEIYNPYHEVGWAPGDGDESTNLVPEPHHALDGFDPFGWLNGFVHSVLDRLPTWKVQGTLDGRQ